MKKAIHSNTTSLFLSIQNRITLALNMPITSFIATAVECKVYVKTILIYRRSKF